MDSDLKLYCEGCHRRTQQLNLLELKVIEKTIADTKLTRIAEIPEGDDTITAKFEVETGDGEVEYEVKFYCSVCHEEQFPLSNLIAYDDEEETLILTGIDDKKLLGYRPKYGLKTTVNSSYDFSLPTLERPSKNG